MALDFVTNQEIIMAARRNLTQNVWHYLTGGAESETTMCRNRFGLDSLAFRPRVLIDVSKIDASTTFLGHKLSIPVMLAPIGSLQSITPEGGVAVARAAEEFGTVNFVSSVTQPSLEEIAAASRNPKIFQLYVQGDLKWVESLLTRVKRAGYSALCLTVDTAHYGHRERQMMDRWLPPSRRGTGYEYRAGLTWETLDAIKQMGGLPFILKGVATAEDADLGRGTRRQRNLRLQSRRTPARSWARHYRYAAGNRRCGARARRDRARRRDRPRQRCAQSHRAGSACRRHRQTSRLGTRRGRSSGFNTGSRNIERRNRNHHGIARRHPPRSTDSKLFVQSSTHGSHP